MNKEYKYILDGFIFRDKEEYEAALRDADTIRALESKVDFSDVNNVYKLYCKINESDTLKTIIGKCYKKKLYDILQNSKMIDFKSIPLIDTEEDSANGNVKVYYQTEFKTIYKDNNKAKKKLDRVNVKLAYWRAIAVIFFIVVVAMFAVVMNSDSISYVNAKDSILDDYSEWEKELQEKEIELEIRENQIKADEKLRSVKEDDESSKM